LARALVTGPKILMADEPTGDLDNRTAELVFQLLQRLHHDYRLTSLIVTHNLDFACRLTACCAFIRDGLRRYRPRRWQGSERVRGTFWSCPGMKVAGLLGFLSEASRA